MIPIHDQHLQSQIRMQGHRVEIIADLELLALAMLKQFYRSTGGVKPARIIFYRDGVSEGQFKQVMVSHYEFIPDLA
jgi:eukaryotic translation initiation factor 2C